jgi:hypothetical protein
VDNHELRFDSYRHELAVGQSPAGKEAEDIVGIRYQETTGKNIANLADLLYVAVRSRVLELTKVL